MGPVVAAGPALAPDTSRSSNGGIRQELAAGVAQQEGRQRGRPLLHEPVRYCFTIGVSDPVLLSLPSTIFDPRTETGITHTANSWLEYWVDCCSRSLLRHYRQN